MKPGDLVMVTHRGDVIDPNPEGYWGYTETHSVFIKSGALGMVIDTRHRRSVGGDHLVNFGGRLCWITGGALEPVQPEPDCGTVDT